MAEISVHDNVILGYEVDYKSRRLVIHTEFNDESGSHERTDVVFERVLGYLFAMDGFINIVFAIEEQPLLQFIESEKENFRRGESYQWPGAWNTGLQASLEHLLKVGAHAYVLESSQGMCGWILATEMRLESLP